MTTKTTRHFVIVRNTFEGDQLTTSGEFNVEELKRYLDEYARNRHIVQLRHMIVVDAAGRACRVENDGLIQDVASRKLFQQWYAEEAR